MQVLVPFDSSFMELKGAPLDYKPPQSHLVTLTDVDLHYLDITCAEIRTDDCAEMILEMYGEAVLRAE